MGVRTRRCSRDSQTVGGPSRRRVPLTQGSRNRRFEQRHGKLYAMSSLEIVQTTAPLVNTVGATSYFNEVFLAHGRELGLKGFPFYFAGRAGVMGNVDAAIVTAAFGYFEPALVNASWAKICSTVEPAAAGRAYLEASAVFGRQVLADYDDDALDAFSDAAEQIRAATDPAGLTLYAGIDAHPLPSDPKARAYLNAVILRELRGSVHLLAIRASGLRAGVAHAIRRPNDTASFGWDPAPAITVADRDLLAQADQRTDELLVPAVASLTEEQSSAFVAGARSLAAAFAG